MNAIQQFGHFLLRKQLYAGIVALLCSAAPMLGIPLIGSLSMMIIGLVTLRKGALAGLFIVVWALVPALVYALHGNVLLVVGQVLIACLLVWLFALLLRHDYSWPVLMEIAAWVGILIVLFVHGYADNITAWWVAKLQGFITEISAIAGNETLAAAMTPQKLHALARIATGIVTSGVILNAIFNLIVARWWQALLFNPGGFRQEFLNIRLSYRLVATLVVAVILIAAGATWAWDVLPPIAIAFFVAGLSLVMDRVLRFKHAWLWLLIFFVFLVLRFVQVGAVVIVLAFIDSLVDLRKRRVIRKS